MGRTIQAAVRVQQLALEATDCDKVLKLVRDWPAACPYEGKLEVIAAGFR